jgi:hypothetical protein
MGQTPTNLIFARTARYNRAEGEKGSRCGDLIKIRKTGFRGPSWVALEKAFAQLRVESGPRARPERRCGRVGSRTRLFADELLFAELAALCPKSSSGLGARHVVAARPKPDEEHSNEQRLLGAQADEQSLDLNG